MAVALAVVFWVIAATHLVACAANWKALRKSTKPALMLALLALYLVGATPVMMAMAVAIVLAGVGDTLLLRQGRFYLMAGGAAFLACHLGYAWTFAKDIDMTAVPIWAWFGLVAYLAAPIGLLVFLRHHLGTAIWPVAFYLSALSLAGFTALLRFACLGTGWALVTWLGSLIFMASDYLLCVDEFRHRFKLGTLTIMSTYSLAQFLIVASFALA